MKKLAALILFALIPVFAFAQSGPPRNTADFYKLKPDQWINKQITLYVAAADQWNYEGPAIPAGFRPLSLFTAYQGESGGWIKALVSDAAYHKIVRDYGAKPQYSQNAQGKLVVASKRLNCLFYEWKDVMGGKEWIVIVK